MSSDDFVLTEEEILLRRVKRHRMIAASVLLVFLLVIGFFSARPTFNAIKGWQARRHAAKAFACIEKENWIEARKEATAAYQLRPTEPQALRAVARFLSRMRQPDALDFWQQLEKLTPLTREDRQDEAAIAIAAGETARAEIAVQALLESKGADPAGWLLAAQLSIQKGAVDDAASALAKVFSDTRTTEQQQQQAALLELSLASGSETQDERVNDAWSRLEKLSRGKSATALDALVLLARRELSSPLGGTGSVPSENKRDNTEVVPPVELSRVLEAHPLAKAPQKLLALDLLEHVDPARHDALVAQAITQWKNGDAADLLALATWLNSKGEFQKTLDTIPLEKALFSRDLFLQHLDALGGLGRWNDIRKILEGERFPLDPVVQRMYLARCNAQLGETTAAENNWQRAQQAAGGDTGKLMTLGEYAEKNGAANVAQSAFDAAATEAPKLRMAQQGRLRVAQRSGDTKKIHGVLADMLRLWPREAAIQNDEAYTRLLLLPTDSTLNSRPSTLNQVEQLAEKLVQRNPRSLPHRTLLALARLRQNRAADALAVYANLQVPTNALTPSALAVHAAVLAANGKIDDAKTEAKQIKRDNLLPEERGLIASILRQD